MMIKKMRMIKKMSFLIFIGLITSCSSSDENETLYIKGKFKHTISGCNNKKNAYVNCVEFINFIDETKVSVLIDGSDIVEVANYEIVDNKVNIELTYYSKNISFLIQDEKTLKRTKKNDIWTKEE